MPPGPSFVGCATPPRRSTPPGLQILVGLDLAGYVAMWLVPYPWLDPLFNLCLLPVVVSVIYLVVLIAQAVRQGRPDAGRILVAVLFISGMVGWSILDMLVLRTDIDVVGWIPFVRAVAFAMIFIDRF